LNYVRRIVWASNREEAAETTLGRWGGGVHFPDRISVENDKKRGKVEIVSDVRASPGVQKWRPGWVRGRA